MAQPASSVHGQHVGTDGPIGDPSRIAAVNHGTDNIQSSTATPTTVDAGFRPNAKPVGTGNRSEEMSTASIKSGVIGMGLDQQQGSDGRPNENTTRQESYIVDTNRSFPLTGGITSQPQSDRVSATQQLPITTPSVQSAAPTSSLHQQTIPEREPGTKEKGAGLVDNQNHEAMAGATAAAVGAGAASAYAHKDRDLREPENTSAPPSSAEKRFFSAHTQSKEDESLLEKGKRLIGLGGSKDEKDNDGSRVPSNAAGSTTVSSPT